MMHRKIATVVSKYLSKRSMGTISFKSFGSPATALEFSSQKAESSAASAGQVKVAIKASPVSYEDIRAISGLSFVNKCTGVAGTTAVGSISSIGSGVSGVSVGDSVLVVGNGLWSDSATVSASSVTKYSGLSLIEAALLPTLVSAWAILTKSGQSLSSGDVVIQTNGGSGVGQAISEVGKALGLLVHSIAESDITKATTPKGAKLCITTATGKSQVDMLKLAGNNGTLVYYNGAVAPLNSVDGVGISITSAVFERKSVTGFDFTAWANANPSALTEGVSKISELLAAKKISLQPSLYSQTDYLKAISAVSSTGAAAVLN